LQNYNKGTSQENKKPGAILTKAFISAYATVHVKKKHPSGDLVSLIEGERLTSGCSGGTLMAGQTRAVQVWYRHSRRHRYATELNQHKVLLGRASALS
jgi:hypothetical protein